MYGADGVGLAAPQVDLSIRVVVIGFRPYDEKTDSYGEVTEQHTLINPEILAFGDEKDYFNEGCLSVPDIHEDVLRPTTVKVHYWDENWEEHTDDATGLYARVVQHELDHLDGKVFTDRLSSLRKTLLKRKLNDIAAGKIRTRYKMKINNRK
jgi:peptide deformylase